MSRVVWQRASDVAGGGSETAGTLSEIAPYRITRVIMESGKSDPEELKRLYATRDSLLETSVRSESVSPPVRNERKVFVVHGRNERLRASLFAFLRLVGLEPIE